MCSVYTGRLERPCVDAIVAGGGHEVFGLTSAGSLQDVSGRCVALEAGKVEFKSNKATCAWRWAARVLLPWIAKKQQLLVLAGGRVKVSSCRWSAQRRQAWHQCSQCTRENPAIQV